MSLLQRFTEYRSKLQRRFTEYRRKRRVMAKARDFWGLIDGYRPVLLGYNGNLYEMGAVRSAIHANASHRSKLSLEIIGPSTKYRSLEKILAVRINPFQTLSQFLYKVSTILDCENSVIIVPLYENPLSDRIIGLFPVHPQSAEIVHQDGEVFVRYMCYGQMKAIELDRCGIIRKFEYKSEIFGDSNQALYPTLDLLKIHKKSIEEAVSASATLRFLVKLSNVFKGDTLKGERDRFKNDNLSGDTGGVLMVDKKYEEVKQIDSSPVVVAPEQMELVSNSIHDYFGVSSAIIQNSFDSDDWESYFLGNVEPFSIQLSQVLTSMLFTDAEIAAGNMVYLSANRLNYASNSEKVNIVSNLFDRGMITVNQGLSIFNLPPLDTEDGDRHFIRKDYIRLENLGAELGQDNPGFSVDKIGEGGGNDAGQNGKGVSVDAPGNPKDGGKAD